jgi:hypothetical protein
MGWNSAVIIMNDALGAIQQDPAFGKNLADAVSYAISKEYVDIPAFYPGGGVHCNAATVVSTQHADSPQVMVVKHNTAWVYRYKEQLPDHVIEDLKWVLKQHGYDVRRSPKKNETKTS